MHARADGRYDDRHPPRRIQEPDVCIVALTGSTSDGDHARCLATGMDAYLAKPAHRAALVHTIDTSFGAPASPEPAAIDVGDLPAQVHGDMALLRRLIRLFREQSASFLADGRRALHRGNPHALDDAAHPLKSVVGHFSTGAVRAYARGRSRSSSPTTTASGSSC